MIKNKVAIIGLGYVGLPLAKLIAKNELYDVHGFDLEKIDFPQASTDPSTINESEYIIVCVPTPVKDDKEPNLTPLKSACQTIAAQLEKGQKIIIESTVNPGICEEVVLPILEESGLKGGTDFELSHCPERINPGDPKWKVSNIPRNIGSLTKEGNKVVADFYRSFIEAEVSEMSCLKVAEATKVIENTFRDINIAYVNELAKSFDIMGIDLHEVIQGASNKPFSFMPHFPGCGVGGHCIPVDPYYLINRAKQAGFDHSFLKKAREINNSMPAYTVQLLADKLDLKNAHIALLGISYKANVSDLRESPSHQIIKILQKKGAHIHKFDPHLPDHSDHPTLEETLEASDALILCTFHDEFATISPELLKKHGIKIVIDGRNCLNKQEIIDAGIIYKGIGH